MGIQLKVKETSTSTISVYIVSDMEHDDILMDGALTTFSFFYRKKGATTYQHKTNYQVTAEILGDGKGGWQTDEYIYTYSGLESGVTYEFLVYIDTDVSTYQVYGSGRTDSSSQSWTYSSKTIGTNISSLKSQKLTFDDKPYRIYRCPVTFKYSGQASFYSQGDLDTFGYLTTENDISRLLWYGSPSTYMEADDDSGDDVNFHITCEVVAGVQYYLIVRAYDGEELGNTTVYVDPPIATLYDVVLNYYDLLGNSISSSQSIKCAQGAQIDLTSYIKDIPGYEYYQIINSEASVQEDTIVIINSNTFFDFYYKESVLMALWDWNSSNGSASDDETIAAYATLDGKGFTINFSHNVWNDLCEKTNIALESIGGYWQTKSGKTFAQDKMTSTDRTLTAIRFNDLMYNIKRPLENSFKYDTSNYTILFPYLTKDVVSGEIVRSEHFVQIAELLNVLINKINDN